MTQLTLFGGFLFAVTLSIPIVVGWIATKIVGVSTTTLYGAGVFILGFCITCAAFGLIAKEISRQAEAS